MRCCVAVTIGLGLTWTNLPLSPHALAGAGQPCPAAWDTLPGNPGVGGVIGALAVFGEGFSTGPMLYAGGSFLTAGGAFSPGVARWDGRAWQALPEASDIGNAFVQMLAVYDDGQGPELYIGGDFSFFAGREAHNIIRWNGFRYDDMRGGTNSIVRQGFAIFDDGGGPALFVGGNFTLAGGVAASGIARWKNGVWSPLGAGVTSGAGIGLSVRAIVPFDDGRGPALFVSGEFTTAGGSLPVSNVARWDGQNWSGVGSGVNDLVRQAIVFDDGRGARLYLGGEFTQAGPTVARRAATWDGLRWEELGGGLDANIRTFAVLDSGAGPLLYVGGLFTQAGGMSRPGGAAWNGSTWLPLGAGVNDEIFALLPFNDGSGAAVWAGGTFSSADGRPATRVARWRLACPGDVDCSGATNFDDIDAFVLALISPVLFELRYPLCDVNRADVDLSGRIDFDDITPFVAALVG